MAKYFGRTGGSFTIYSDVAGSPDVRFAVAHFGEDPEKVIAAFWGEKTGEFVVVPLFAYGAAPRKELCSPRSLTAAVQTAQFDAGSRTEQQWREVCEFHKVPSPKRLAA